jgi:hypothetical protein
MGRKLYETTGFIGALKVSPKGDLVAFADEPLAGDVSGYVRVVDRTGQTKAVSRKWSNIQGLDWAASEIVVKPRMYFVTGGRGLKAAER